jgi:hypothetical protein
MSQILSARSLDESKLDVSKPALPVVLGRWAKTLGLEPFKDPTDAKVNLKAVLTHVQEQNLQENAVPPALRDLVKMYLGGFGPPTGGTAPAETKTTEAPAPAKGKGGKGKAPDPKATERDAEAKKRVAQEQAKKVREAAKETAQNKALAAKGQKPDEKTGLGTVPAPTDSIFVVPFSAIAKTFDTLIKNETAKDKGEARIDALLGLDYRRLSSTFTYFKTKVFNKNPDTWKNDDGGVTFPDKDGKKIVMTREEFLKKQKEFCSAKFEEWAKEHGAFSRKEPQTYRRYARIADSLIDADGKFSTETLNRISEVGTTKVEKILKLSNPKEILTKGITFVDPDGKSKTFTLDELSASQLGKIVEEILNQAKPPETGEDSFSDKMILTGTKKLRDVWHRIKVAKKGKKLNEEQKVQLLQVVDWLETEVIEYVRQKYGEQKT